MDLQCNVFFFFVVDDGNSGISKSFVTNLKNACSTSYFVDL